MVGCDPPRQRSRTEAASEADAIERQLAHQEADEIRGAYTLAAEFWQERRADDGWWAHEFDRLREHGRVIKMIA
jgi:hypothetical protein